MKILFLTHRTPWPPMKGFQVRPYHMMKALSEDGHRVDLMSLARDDKDAAGQGALEKLCHSVLLSRTSLAISALHSAMAVALGKPITYGYFFTSELKNAVQAYLAQENPDAIVLYSSAMAQYVPTRWRKHCFADIGDVDSVKWAEYGARGDWPKRLLHAMEGRRLLKIEKEIARDFGRVNLAAERELDVYRALDAAADLKNFVTITNGAELDNFYPQPRADLDLSKIPEGERKWFASARGPVMIFTGAMDYAPNVEAVTFFAEQVLPDIRKVHADAQFIIVGSKPTDAVKALAATPGVGVTGFVDKVQPYFAIADVYVAPLMLARGVQNKIIEAMACGAPIVCTTGAHEGIAGQPGREYLLADTSDQFKTVVLDLIAKPDRQQALAKAARDFVIENLDWKKLMVRFVAEVKQIARQ